MKSTFPTTTVISAYVLTTLYMNIPSSSKDKGGKADFILSGDK